jgi:type VI secretion system protein ImpD
VSSPGAESSSQGKAETVLYRTEDPGPATAPSAPTLLETVLALGTGDTSARGSSVQRLLAAEGYSQQLKAWAEAANVAPSATTLRKAARLINREIALIDQAIAAQVNAILHHPAFQKLESSWRGLRYLVDQQEDFERVKIRMLDVSWKQLVRDLDRSIEFDQSQLFRKVYSDEFGNPGGEPFSILMGDYEIKPGFQSGNAMSDIDALGAISQVAAASFAPFISSAHPSLLSLSNFSEFHRPSDWQGIFEQPEFRKWNSLRKTTDSRFVGLVFPRVLFRRPYQMSDRSEYGFRFEEDCSGPGTGKLLWGNAAYALASVVMRSFQQTGWPASIRGVRSREGEAGLVTGLPEYPFRTGEGNLALHCPLETVITDEQEAEMSELGFIPLCHCKDSNQAAFYSSPSVQKADHFDEEFASVNARISSMLQYMLCVSRLSHYVKVIGRDKVGSYAEAIDCENTLNEWLQQYITQDEQAPLDVKAQYPLRAAQVSVRDQPGKPGHYFCTIHLQPHYDLDDIVSSITLTTELAPTR